jgi:hypothetical protein
MYNRYYPGKRGQIKEIFKLGVELFIKAAKQSPVVISEGGIRCPCAVCECGRFRSEDEIKYHLYLYIYKRIQTQLLDLVKSW